ncbi:MAG TPA: sulfotransferase domain-containing protein [Bacteroidia bacterium]|nr:sulfotransferase domain-containing protein [Bacteroidia bacterium]
MRKKTKLSKIIQNRATWFLRSLNSNKRALPDFIIFGAAKGGTTSLFNYLAAHPDVLPPIKKEIHYFDRNYRKGDNWYRMHFPLKQQLNKNGRLCITGEASPYYISHPLVPARIKKLVPDVKLIALLRNPIDRALSNYQHMVRLGIETQSLEKALELEESRIAGERDKLIQDPCYYSYNHHHFSYINRGIYHKELEPWFDIFPREQLLINSSEQFYEEPDKVFSSVVRFIGLNDWSPEQFKAFNSGGDYAPISPELRKKLQDFYRPHNETLFKMLGTRFHWD